ncbi:hypothetical protein ACEPAF_9143 [Sanghuangporus sanghuang]
MRRLALFFETRYTQRGEASDLEKAIMMSRGALELCPGDHPLRSLSLYNLASCLSKHFKHSRHAEDLEEAILLHRAALKLRPEGHSDHCISLNNLASSLWTRFDHRGRMEDLEEAISLLHAALVPLPVGHPLRPTSLSNLALYLSTRFKYGGHVEDLEEAISVIRAALELLPEGHSNRPTSLNNLASSLSTRFDHRGRMEDLEEAISLLRAALGLLPVCHPLRPACVNNLALYLSTSFKHSGRAEDLEEAISILRVTLELLPESHLYRFTVLNNLALSLSTRFNHERRTEDLQEAISLLRAVLVLLPEGNLLRSTLSSNLALYLWTRFEHQGWTEDLEEAISLHRTSVELLPEGHPHHSTSLGNLAIALYARFMKDGRTDDLEESVQSLNRAAVHTFSSFSTRLGAVRRWTKMARCHGHQSLPEAHRIAMSLLQRVLTIRPTLSAQHRLLSSDSHYQSLALDAAADSIDNGDFPQAIEFLVQGRALLWSQLRVIRAPQEQLSRSNKALAERFERCNCRLEALIASAESSTFGLGQDGSVVRAVSTSQGQNLVDEMLVQMRQLHEEQEAIITDIRRMPGFENFLRAAPFEVIQQAASEGPVIILNHSKYRCDALILLPRGNNPCVCIPLDEDFHTDTVELHGVLSQVRREFRVASCEYDEILRRVMKTLWDRVVSKVVQGLKEIGIMEGSRIWWCPTSVLSAFPFHAAGPYEDAAGNTKYLLDDYISSYTPTLTSLINARSEIQNGNKRMLFVGDTKLASAKKERDAVRRSCRIDKQLLDEQATPDAVLRMLRRVQWVHFVCHGLLDEEPFSSSLKLHGGGLTLLDIARANLPNAELAFLSACHTAEQAPKSALDEALHLAAAMQFCGFRSVVGTMWQLLDKDGPYLASAVYWYLMRDLEDGEVRFKRAAAAVREAALRLRERGDEGPDGRKVEIMAERWVNLVHIGA